MSNTFKTSIYKKNKIIVTDGMMGGGKTLICNLVSGIKNVEQWIYDSNIERICALNNLNRINVSVSADFIKKIYNEKYFDNFILRHSNFRDKDFSSIKNHPRSREIIKRLKMTDKVAEKKVKKAANILQFMTHTLTPYAEPVFKAFEKKLLYIIILRNPSNLFALKSMARWTDLFKKIDSRDGRINYYSKKYKVNLPYELNKANTNHYSELNNYEKAIYLIEDYYYKSLKSLFKFSKKYKSDYIIIPFEKLTTNPNYYLKKISQKLGSKLDKVFLENMKKNKVPRTFPDKKLLFTAEKIKEDLKDRFEISDKVLIKNKIRKSYFKKFKNLEKFYIKEVFQKY